MSVNYTQIVRAAGQLIADRGLLPADDEAGDGETTLTVDHAITLAAPSRGAAAITLTALYSNPDFPHFGCTLSSTTRLLENAIVNPSTLREIFGENFEDIERLVNRAGELPLAAAEHWQRDQWETSEGYEWEQWWDGQGARDKAPWGWRLVGEVDAAISAAARAAAGATRNWPDPCLSKAASRVAQNAATAAALHGTRWEGYGPFLMRAWDQMHAATARA